MNQTVLESLRVTGEPGFQALEITGWASGKDRIAAVQIWCGERLLGYLPYGFSGPEAGKEGLGFEGCVPFPPEASAIRPPPMKLVFLTTRCTSWESGFALPPDVHGVPVPVSSLPSSSPRLAAPDFFILGAAKCGTTTLHHALSQHPEIHLSHVKEPTFFCRDFQVIGNAADYGGLFPWQEGKLRYGEASHAYLTAPESPALLHQFFPDARFIVIVRNPAERAYSLYQHMRRNGLEPITGFEQALDEEESRYHSAKFRRECPQYFWNYMYARSSRYDEQLSRYGTFFKPGQFFLLTLGEWQSGSSVWLQRIFRFLGVDPGMTVDSVAQNQGAGDSTLPDATRKRLDQQFSGWSQRLEPYAGRELQFTGL